MEQHQKRIQHTKTDFIRSLGRSINWNLRLVGIKGARGVGKTTLLLQYIKQRYGFSREALYVSLDNLWFAENKLLALADLFVKRGGTHLFLDEVHKYPTWAQEIKNIYDSYPELKVVFTGSSLLEILNARADLSRRAIIYQMQGLSFREYLGMYHNVALDAISLEDVFQNSESISESILSKSKPLKYFGDYLRSGYYPFYQESPEFYYTRIGEVANMILEIELPLLRNIEVAYVQKIKQLLQIIATSSPFVPNIAKLSERIGISRNTLISYLFYLNEAHLINAVYKDAGGITVLQKPDKLFMENTNLAYALSSDHTDIGNMRETFFVNQVGFGHKVEYTSKGDFLVDGKYTVEIGGKNKGQKQIEGVDNAFLAVDDMEYGIYNKIPLWMFGLLY